jgi:undecaprenyl-diphosphatase
MQAERASSAVDSRDTSRVDPARHLLGIAGVCGGLALVAIPTVDAPVARWLAGRDTWPALWDRGIAVLEYAAGLAPWAWTGVTVLAIAAVAAVVRRRQHAWIAIAIAHLLARNVSLWLKTATGRLRPYEWLARGGDPFFRDGGIAFPSGHVVTFASLALPIAIAFPRARGVLAVIPFAMVARVTTGAHFVSDVLAGLALAAAATWLAARAVPRSPTPRSSRR